MPSTPVWLASIEALLNRSIGPRPSARAAARRLEGRSLEVDIEGIVTVRIAVGAERLSLTAGGGEAPADATVAGSPWALYALFTGAGAGTGNGAAAARIGGDAEVAGHFRELLALARPDVEEELSRLVGDFAARRMAQRAHAAFSFVRRAGRTTARNVAEYLEEESRDLVSKAELEEFLQGVDRLRETADRIEARLARLEQRLKSGS
jgi:ubiquinone biosynthesis protein UbiJ